MKNDKEVATMLLKIKAVELKPSDPFRWVSGILAPIYCDNRLLMSNILERERVCELMCDKIKEEVGLDNFDKICGIATSGIAPAAWIANKLNKPMIYVRKKGKGYGKKNRIEGTINPGDRIIVVEDLISTGGSSFNGVEGVREQGGICNHCLAIFTYEMEESKKLFEGGNCQLLTMTNFSTLVEVALENNLIKLDEMQSALDWSKNPWHWGDKFDQPNKIELTEKEKVARTKVCLPLDGLNSLEEIKQRVKELSPVVGLFKIGKESFTRFGPEAIKLVQKYGSNVFFDSKYNDIPNTVKGAASAAAELGVYMFNVHASGGLEMMQAAVAGAKQGAERFNTKIPKIVAVTVLTSINQENLNQQLKVPGIIEEQVLHLAKLAEQAEMDGVVCSAADLRAIKNKFSETFMFVTPGIKGPNTPAGIDQKRVFTPGNAIQDGSTILVIGRAITGQPTAELRLQAGKEILEDIAKMI